MKTIKGYIENGVYRKLEDEKNKLRMSGGSWTLNVDELKKLKQIQKQGIDSFELTTKTKIYTIDKELAKVKGFRKILGGEDKLVVPIKHWDVKEK